MMGAVDLDWTVGLALAISAVALAASLTSLWQSALKPAAIAIDNLRTEIAGGGLGEGQPSLHQVTLTLAVSNDGARSGVITRIDLKRVWSTGDPSFATGASERARYYATPTLREIGGAPALELPAGIKPGDVMPVSLAFELEGPFRTLYGTQALEEPNLTPFAVTLRDVKSVHLVIRVEYRARRSLITRRRKREATQVVEVSGSEFRKKARELWDAQRRKSLVEILDEADRH